MTTIANQIPSDVAQSKMTVRRNLENVFIHVSTHGLNQCQSCTAVNAAAEKEFQCKGERSCDAQHFICHGKCFRVSKIDGGIFPLSSLIS